MPWPSSQLHFHIMPDAFTYDVFLSHNHADKPQVRRLAERLKAAGVRVWLDEWVIQAGDIIALKVDEGLEQSRVLLLCISPAALASGWVALERSTAVHRDPANAGRRFVPLLLGDCALPDTLRRYKYVDFREESEAVFAEVLATCQPETQTLPSALTPESQKVSAVKKAEGSKPRQNTEPLESKLAGHSGKVMCVSVSPDGKSAVSGSADKTLRIWDLVTHECRVTLERHTHAVTSVAIAPDGRRIISGSSGGGIRVFDANTLVEKHVFNHSDAGILSLVSLTDSSRLVSKEASNKINVWDLYSGELIKSISVGLTRGDQYPSSTMDYDERSGASLIAGGYDEGYLALWDLTSEDLLVAIKVHEDKISSLQISPDYRFIVTGSHDKTVRVLDLSSMSCTRILEGHKGKVIGVAISTDCELIASVSETDQTVRVWEWKSGICLQTFVTEADDAPHCICFYRDSSRLIVGTSKGSLNVYRIERGAFVEKAMLYVNAKVVLLGEGTVGKTSLAHRLIEDKYVVRDRTHGMNVWRLPLPFPPDATLEREALLWDLAGQEDYRLIHQLFLDQTAVALMLVNPQNPDPFVDVGDWLKALKTTNAPEAKRDAARLLIFSQIDVGGMKLGNAKIDLFREQHGFADWLPTSAKTGENCSDKKNKGKPSKLKQLIAGSIPWDKLPWTSTPRLLAELKNAVMAMRDESDIRLLRFSELAQRLEQALPGEKFGESDLRTAVTLLANHGLARPLKFGDLVLLRPDLINGYAGAVIRAARAHTDEIGCVLEADIYRPDFDFTGVERLKHRPDEELLLRALVQTFLDHSLCIAEDTPHGRHMVFPSQYRREKDLPHEPDIFVSYSFSGEWQTVWTTLVVRLWYSQEFAHRELWRNAAEFESARKQTLGLKITKVGDGAATISLYFDHGLPDELKVIFIEYVHRHLAKYACEVSRDRRYVCPECGKLVKDLDAVRRRLEAKKDFITCQECDEKVPFVDFIKQRLKSDPVARKILAMDETATRELDTQALEQILIGHMMAIAGEANQIFRPVTMFDHGIDGEVEFKDNDGKASGKRIYIQLKSGNSYLRTRKGDGSEVFDVKNDRHLDYWVSQPVDVYLVIRQTDDLSGQQVIRWMNVTRYLKARKDKKSRQIIFSGEKLDMEAVWKVRDCFFPKT